MSLATNYGGDGIWDYPNYAYDYSYPAYSYGYPSYSYGYPAYGVPLW